MADMTCRWMSWNYTAPFFGTGRASEKLSIVGFYVAFNFICCHQKCGILA